MTRTLKIISGDRPVHGLSKVGCLKPFYPHTLTLDLEFGYTRSSTRGLVGSWT